MCASLGGDKYVYSTITGPDSVSLLESLTRPPYCKLLLPFVPNTITKTIAGSDVDSYFHWRFSKKSCICFKYGCVPVCIVSMMHPLISKLGMILVQRSFE